MLGAPIERSRCSRRSKMPRTLHPSPGSRRGYVRQSDSLRKGIRPPALSTSFRRSSRPTRRSPPDLRGPEQGGRERDMARTGPEDDGLELAWITVASAGAERLLAALLLDPEIRDLPGYSSTRNDYWRRVCGLTASHHLGLGSRRSGTGFARPFTRRISIERLAAPTSPAQTGPHREWPPSCSRQSGSRTAFTRASLWHSPNSGTRCLTKPGHTVLGRVPGSPFPSRPLSLAAGDTGLARKLATLPSWRWEKSPSNPVRI